MKKNQLWIVAVVVVVVIGIIVAVAMMHGNKQNGGMNMANVSGAVATSNVTIQNYMFNPMIIKVKVGTTVTWTNKDSVHHTVTADTTTSNAPSSMDIAQGKSYSFTFKKAGTYTYHCFPHPYMHGTVEVTN